MQKTTRDYEVERVRAPAVARTVGASPMLASAVIPSPATPKGTPVNNRRPERNGLKDQVEMTDRGWIDGTCAGKSRWHYDLRNEVLRWCDLSVIHWVAQPPCDWAQAKSNINARWEYLGQPGVELDTSVFDYYRRNIIKNERFRILNVWKNEGEDPNAPTPEMVKNHVWNRLLAYFKTTAAKAKSEQMIAAQRMVVNPNLNGSRGNAHIALQMVRCSYF
jgi:hypothetical protein